MSILAQKPRVVILGGGFAGVYTAMALEKSLRRSDDFEIALVNSENHFVFQPMLPDLRQGFEAVVARRSGQSKTTPPYPFTRRQRLKCQNLALRPSVLASLTESRYIDPNFSLKYLEKEIVMMARSTLLVLLLVSASLPAFAQEKTAPTPVDPPKSGFRAEFLTGWDDLEKKAVSLAEAMPQEKYSWRPGEGVRSVGEVFAHMAAGNYQILMSIRITPPAEVDVQNMEKRTEKVKIVGALKASFNHVRQAILRTPDADLDKPAKLGKRDATVREVLFYLATHQPEHLGQSIAYARMNNVVPPWTAERQSQQQEGKK